MSENAKIKLFADVHGRRRVEIPALGDGFYVELRNELTVGEERQMFADAIKGQTDLGDGKIRTEYDATKLSFAQVLAYLVDWSAKEEIVPDRIRGLTADAFRLIEAAVEQHVEALGKKRKPATKEKTPTPAGEVISISVA